MHGGFCGKVSSQLPRSKGAEQASGRGILAFSVMGEGEDNVLSAVNVLFNALQPQQKKDIISAVGQDEEV